MAFETPTLPLRRLVKKSGPTLEQVSQENLKDSTFRFRPCSLNFLGREFWTNAVPNPRFVAAIISIFEGGDGGRVGLKWE